MKEAVIDALNRVSKRFKVEPQLFFNEHDFHHHFFNEFQTKSLFLLHPEYPTNKRFIREKDENEKYSEGKHSFNPKLGEKQGKRGHYDFAVLNEKFYNENHRQGDGYFDKLSNKKVGINYEHNQCKYVDVAIEFKYITTKINEKSRKIAFVEEVEFDIFKLKEATEVNNKMLVVFTREESNLPVLREKLKHLLKEYSAHDLIVLLNGEKV